MISIAEAVRQRRNEDLPSENLLISGEFQALS